MSSDKIVKQEDREGKRGTNPRILNAFIYIYIYIERERERERERVPDTIFSETFTKSRNQEEPAPNKK